jgi:predicted transcriptional regulator
MAKYGLTPEQYRSKWGLPVDYPMVAPSYARERSEVAKRTGLGRTPAAKELPNRRAKTRAR